MPITNCLCPPFSFSRCAMMVGKRPTLMMMMTPVVTSLRLRLLLGLCLLLNQTLATDEAVDLNHIRALSAEIDLRTSYAAWLHLPHPLPPPSPSFPPHTPTHPQHPNSPPSSSSSSAHSSLQGQAETGRDAPNSSSSHPLHALKGGPDRVSGSGHDIPPHPGLASPRLPGKAAAASAAPGSPTRPQDKDTTRVAPTPSSSSSFFSPLTFQPHKPAASEEERGHVKPKTSTPAKHPEEKGAAPNNPEEEETEAEEEAETEAEEADDNSQTHTLSSTPRRSLKSVEDPVTHMSAKRLSKLEEDLAKRRQTAPEHKLYHEDLLLRRLKTLRQDHRHGKGEEEKERVGEDSWEEELRLRRELAAKAEEYGAQRKKDRQDNPDPNRPLSVLERIRKDAEEILRRRAQEREYLKTMLKNGAKTEGVAGGGSFHFPSSERGEREDLAGTERLNSLGAVQIMRWHGLDSASADRPAATAAAADARSAVHSPSAARTKTADLLRKVSPEVSRGHHSSSSSRQRRKRKKHSRALVRTLNKQKRLV